MTRTRLDTAKNVAFTLGTWWNTRDAWTQVFIAAGLLCAFELLVLWRAYPWLLGLVTS